MPTFRVKTSITLGKVVEEELVTHEFKPGDTIELSKEEAEKLQGALENPPVPSNVRAMAKDERRAYDSHAVRPSHPDAVPAWKLDNSVLPTRPPEKSEPLKAEPGLKPTETKVSTPNKPTTPAKPVTPVTPPEPVKTENSPSKEGE